MIDEKVMTKHGIGVICGRYRNYYGDGVIVEIKGVRFYFDSQDVSTYQPHLAGWTAGKRDVLGRAA
jgi:hypothetical protein